jgi:hypothetical protein
MEHMTNESDIHRAEWEGMTTDPKESMSEDLKGILTIIKEKFDSDETIWGVRDAVREIIGDMETNEEVTQDDKDKFLRMINENFFPDKELSFDSLKDFFTNQGGDILRGHMRSFLGEKEWDDFEKEGGKRALRHDQTFGGTPG